MLTAAPQRRSWRAGSGKMSTLLLLLTHCLVFPGIVQYFCMLRDLLTDCFNVVQLFHHIMVDQLLIDVSRRFGCCTAVVIAAGPVGPAAPPIHRTSSPPAAAHTWFWAPLFLLLHLLLLFPFLVPTRMVRSDAALRVITSWLNMKHMAKHWHLAPNTQITHKQKLTHTTNSNN